MRNYTLVTELTSYAIFKTDTLPMLSFILRIYFIEYRDWNLRNFKKVFRINPKPANVQCSDSSMNGTCYTYVQYTAQKK